VRLKTYIVYRVDYRTNKQELIGKVMERRREERVIMPQACCNWQKIYATSSFDSNIFVINEGFPWGAFIQGRISHPDDAGLIII